MPFSKEVKELHKNFFRDRKGATRGPVFITGIPKGRKKALEKKKDVIKFRDSGTNRVRTARRHGKTPGGTKQYRDKSGGIYSHVNL